MVSRTLLRTQPDGRLAALAAAGSEPAFEAIVHRYRRPLLGYCRRLRMADNRSEDVVQQTFLKAWGSLRDGTEVRDLRPWLYRITHNQAVSMMRSVGADEAELNELNGATAVITTGGADGAVSADDVYERQARLRATLTAVASLPELQREALLATAIDGLSYEETAMVLGTSSEAVRGLVYRARSTVRTAVAAISPVPLVIWAANQGSQVVNAASVQQMLSEAATGGGSLGISAAAVKGAIVLASSAAVVTGTVEVGKPLIPLPGLAAPQPAAVQRGTGRAAAAGLGAGGSSVAHHGGRAPGVASAARTTATGSPAHGPTVRSPATARARGAGMSVSRSSPSPGAAGAGPAGQHGSARAGSGASAPRGPGPKAGAGPSTGAPPPGLQMSVDRRPPQGPPPVGAGGRFGAGAPRGSTGDPASTSAATPTTQTTTTPTTTTATTSTTSTTSATSTTTTATTPTESTVTPTVTTSATATTMTPASTTTTSGTPAS